MSQEPQCEGWTEVPFGYEKDIGGFKIRLTCDTRELGWTYVVLGPSNTSVYGGTHNPLDSAPEAIEAVEKLLSQAVDDYLASSR